MTLAKLDDVNSHYISDENARKLSFLLKETGSTFTIRCEPFHDRQAGQANLWWKTALNYTFGEEDDDPLIHVEAEGQHLNKCVEQLLHHYYDASKRYDEVLRNTEPQ